MGKVLITGATGFIGGRLVERLVADGRDVRCLARRGSGVAHFHQRRVELVEGDVTALATLAATAADVDLVFHVAGLTKALRRSDFFHVNELGVANVLAACAKRTTPPAVVVVSSLAAAGPALLGQPRTEADPPAPVSHYGRSKRAGELAAIARAGDLPITIVRPPIVLGGGDRTGLALFRMIANLGVHLVPGWRRSKYSIIHVTDLVSGLIQAAEHGNRLSPAIECEPEQVAALTPALSQREREQSCGEVRRNEIDKAARLVPAKAAELTAARGIYFLSGESDLTYSELGHAIATAVGRRRLLVVRVPGPVVWPIVAFTDLAARLRGKPSISNIDKAREALAGDWTCSSARAQQELGFRPAAPLADRLAETVQWYRREGWM